MSIAVNTATTAAVGVVCHRINCLHDNIWVFPVFVLFIGFSLEYAMELSNILITKGHRASCGVDLARKFLLSHRLQPRGMQKLIVS
jgi:hypothetical protein